MNLIAPAASGSVALVLRSMRSFQPFGACATSGTARRTTNAAAVKRRIMLFSPDQEFEFTNLPIYQLRARTLWFPPLRQIQLVGLAGRELCRRAFVPARNRVLARRVQRFHRLPDFVDAVVEQIPDEQIGHGAAKVGVVLHEVAEAEPIVILAHETAHPIDAGVEGRSPFAELRL